MTFVLLYERRILTADVLLAVQRVLTPLPNELLSISKKSLSERKNFSPHLELLHNEGKMYRLRERSVNQRTDFWIGKSHSLHVSVSLFCISSVK